MQKRVRPILYSDEQIVIPPYRVNRLLFILEAIIAGIMFILLVSDFTAFSDTKPLHLLTHVLLFLSAVLLGFSFLQNLSVVTIDAEGVTAQGPVTRKRLLWSEIQTIDFTLPLGASKEAPKDRTLCFAAEPQNPDRVRTKGRCVLVPLTMAESEQFEAEGLTRCRNWQQK